MVLLVHKWFPREPATEENIGRAIWLENDHWEKMNVAIANGINKAFKR